MKRLAAAFALAVPMILSPMPTPDRPAAPVVLSAEGWSGPIRLPWYGAEHYGSPVACPGYGKYTRWRVSVAVRDGDTRFRCGDRVELRQGRRRIVATVTDRFASWAPSWVLFDASAAIACNHLNPKRLKPVKPGRYRHCYTRDGVMWRRVP